MRRTQQAVSAVWPSVGVTYGLRKVASRVSPSGNWVTGPSGTHERYAFARPRVIEERRNGTIGTANAVPTNPLNRIPIFMNSPRRVSIVSFDMVRLLALLVIGHEVRLPRVLHAARGEPRNDIGDFLVRHRLAWHISAPVGRPQFRTAGDDDRAQALIAHERQKRIIGNGAALWAAPASRAVARFAIRFERGFASLNVTRRFRNVRGRVDPIQNSGPAPARSDPRDDHIDLLVCQHSA